MEFPNFFLLIFNFLFFIYLLFKIYIFRSNFPQLPVPEDYEVADSVDRLSELPDSLIIEILSWLPMRDVVGTTFLSKRWKDLWVTVPCLQFEHPWDYHGVREFRNFVCGALSHWRGPRLVKFSLRCRPRCILDSWLIFAIEKQVEELEIWVMETEDEDLYGPHPTYVEYCLPSYVYLCSSIKKLTLRACRLKVVENVRWDNLVSLSIETLDYFLGNIFNQLLSGAPRLEILDLEVLGDRHDLIIRSNRLKVFKIHLLPDIVSPMLRIDAPNLETMQITGVAYTRCLLKVPALTNAVLDFSGQAAVVEEGFLRQALVSIHHVQKLTLTDLCIEALCEMRRKNMALPLSNAKFVRLFASPAHKILDVLEMFPQLRMLVIVREDMFFGEIHASNLIDPQIDFPASFLMHLRRVEVAWLLRDSSIDQVIEVLLKNAGVLEKMVFRPILRDEEEEMLSSYSLYEVEESVLSMPRSSPTAQVIVSPSSSYEWNWYRY